MIHIKEKERRKLYGNAQIVIALIIRASNIFSQTYVFSYSHIKSNIK